MRVELAEVELAGDQEEHGPHGFEPAVAAGLTLGRLEQAIERFEEAVGLSGLGPSDDAVEVHVAPNPRSGFGGMFRWNEGL